MKPALSKASAKLLMAAYEYYLQTSETTYSYRFSNLRDWELSTEAAVSLHKEGYISNLSDSAFDDEMSVLAPEPLVFMLTSTGIEAARTYKED